MDPLSDLLRVVRLDGAFFYAVEAAEPWSVETVAAEELTPRIMPAAEHLISYHILTSGTCWGGVAGDEQTLMHPGDALFTPGEPVDVLATPAAAPWMKISEAVDYLRAVAPTHAVPIHQAIIDPSARGIFYGRLSEMTDTDFQVLEPESGTDF